MEPYAIIDAHVHSFDNGTQGIRDLLASQKQYGYTASNFLSCECLDDAAQNALGIYMKALAPENYAFGGLHYRYAYPYASDARQLWEMGFDGMKMVENKPGVRKKLGMPQNHPDYDGYYAFLQENGIPLLCHVADPEECWDRERIPPWCYDAGYYYGEGGYAAKETLYAEMLDVLRRFPKLNVILAHLFFLSADLHRLTGLMEAHPRMHLDLVSGTEMYWNFAADPEGWRSFFIKYQDRILYGTDNVNAYDAQSIQNRDITNHLQQKFLTTEGPVPAWDKTSRGIGLPRAVNEKIFGGNFQRLCGGGPRPLDRAKASAYLQRRLDDKALRLNAYETTVIREVLDFVAG